MNMASSHRRWIFGCVMLGCGPNGGQDGTDASSESTDDGGATSSRDPSGGATSVSTTDTTGTIADTGPVDDTGPIETDGGPQPCNSSAQIDPTPLAPRDYVGALLRVEPPNPLVPARLVFGGELDGLPFTAILAADVIEGPWLLAQELEGVAPHDIGDIDGDGRDDLVVVDDVGAGTWWAAMPDDTLASMDSFAVAGDADALVRLPGEPRAAIVRVDTELSLASGIGDGTFGPPTPVPPMSPDVSWSAPIVVWGEGIVSVGTTLNDCKGSCTDDTVVLTIDGSGAVTPIGSLSAGDELLDVADIDGDGLLDLLLRDDEDGALRIHRGGQATFDPPPLDLPTDDATAVDVDDDGDLDVHSTQTQRHTIQYNDAGVLGSSASNTLNDNFGTPATLGRAVDLDGNGIAEVMMSSNNAWHELRYTDYCEI